MQPFQYYMPTRLVFGKGVLNQLYAQQIPGSKALIVITQEKLFRELGFLTRVEEQLDMAGISHVVFDQAEPNPVLKSVALGAQAALDNECDFVIGLGGGSSMDTAKAIAVMATNPGSFWDYNMGITGLRQQVTQWPLPIVCITTTAGTGSEVDPWAVLTKEDTYEKLGFGFEGTYPTLAIVDPELTLSVPSDYTAYQGFDALFHAVESVINTFQNPLGELYALKSIEYLRQYLPVAVSDGSNEEARGYVALASTMAGFVMLCTSHHSLEHALSAHHQALPHGAGLIMLSLAYFRKFIQAQACDQKFVQMARLMGRSEASEATEFLLALEEMQQACGVSGLKMSDFGIAWEELPNLVTNARQANGGLFACDPAVLSDADCLEILQQSYH